MSTIAESFTPTTDNPFIRALAIGTRYSNTSPLTYFIEPSDHDNDGVNDWNLHGAGDGLRAAVASWASVINLSFTEVSSAAEANWVERILQPYSFSATAYHYFPNSTVGVYGGGYDLLPNSNPGENVVGGEGSDSLEGGAGADTIYGGDGSDGLFDVAGADFISGGDGDDLLLGELGNDTLLGGNGRDTLLGGYGDDRLDPGLGFGSVDGGAGTDTLTLADWAAQSDQPWYVQANRTNGTISLNGIVQVEFSSIETFDLQMGGGNDLFSGTIEGNSTVRGGGGHDRIYGVFGDEYFMGEAGNDTLEGGPGNDRLDGGDDDDRLVGGGGDDSIDGGGGIDRAVFTDAFTDCVISFEGDICIVETKNEGIDRLSNIETAEFAGVVKTMAELRASAVDRAGPIPTGIWPADGATGIVTNANIVATFDEAIARGAGSITLRRGDGSVVETFNVATSNRIVIAGSTLMIDPTQHLAAGTHYSVTIAAGAIKDLSGNAHIGLADYDFTTAAAANPSRLVVLSGFVGSWGGRAVFSAQPWGSRISLSSIVPVRSRWAVRSAAT